MKPGIKSKKVFFFKMSCKSTCCNFWARSCSFGEGLYQRDAAPTLQQLPAIQETGNPQLPVDDCGYGNDVFQLATQSKALPQDKPNGSIF